MRPLALAVLAGLTWAAAWGPAGAAEPGAASQMVAQLPRLPQAGGKPDEPKEPPHRAGELECRNCHEGKHQGVVRMYLGQGGRGTPMIPSHMFQVRVECIACHVLPKEAAGTARLVGQTFKPSEQACLGCHGEKYRGMLDRWTTTLGKMHEIVAPKLKAAQAAVSARDPKNPKHDRARKLLEDAEFNLQFVTFAKGIHNVFYAADLLKLANLWLDEAAVLLGKAPAKADDALVRGGYCGVMCHEQAAVKLPDSVTFGKQKIPHARHVSEFGAVCTACHSAEVHKAVTATAATCSSCHHDPLSERCEGCHRAQSAFYRGETRTGLAKMEPNVMASAVSCTGCHDLSRKHSRESVNGKCVGCHDASYAAFTTEWTADLDKEVGRTGEAVRRAESALAKERRAGRKKPEADGLLAQARAALDLVRKARGVHNPPGAQALLEAARVKAEAAASLAAQR